MKNDFVQLVIAAMALTVSGALEELLPKFLCVGAPLLLMVSVFVSGRWGPVAAMLTAVAAGSMEDALCSLPLFASVSFFVLVGIATHLTGLMYVCMAFAYPLYQLWLWLWLPGMAGSVFGRVLLALPAGVAAGVVVSVALRWAEQKGAVDVEG